MQIIAPQDTIPSHAVPYFAGIKAGYEVDIRTPLFEGKDRKEVSDLWMDMLQPLRIYDDLMELEESQKSKIGPLSIRLPLKDRMKDVESYYTSGFESGNQLSEMELGLLKQQERRLRPIDAASSANRLPTNTNSGLPMFKKRNTVREQSIAMAIRYEPHAAILGWRGQSNGTSVPKQRVVWMFPYSLNISEGQFFVPLFEMLKRLPPFAAWNSMSQVDIGITDILVNRRSNQIVLSSDFSGYDQNVTYQQKWYFDYLRFMFQSNTHSLIEKLERDFREIGLVIQPDQMVVGKHGVPSGSTFTNLADSIINYLAQISSPMVSDFTRVQVQGDDCVISVEEVEKHISHLESLGLPANIEKQYASEKTCHYLQRLHSLDHMVQGVAVGAYPTMRALNSLLGQERIHEGWSSEMVSLRTVMILENCKDHPAFEQFVDFVVKFGDKRLIVNLQKILSDKSYIQTAKAIPGFVPTYNSDAGLTGLENFSTLRVLKSK